MTEAPWFPPPRSVPPSQRKIRGDSEEVVVPLFMSKVKGCYPLIIRHCSPNMTHEDSATHANGVVHVSIPILVLSALPLLCLAFIGHDLGMKNELIVGIIRSFVQLMILGLILHPIFIIGMGMPWLVGICE
jgi:hypothetical protein